MKLHELPEDQVVDGLVVLIGPKKIPMKVTNHQDRDLNSYYWFIDNGYRVRLGGMTKTYVGTGSSLTGLFYFKSQMIEGMTLIDHEVVLPKEPNEK
jgi:hypothetical protein